MEENTNTESNPILWIVAVILLLGGCNTPYPGGYNNSGYNNTGAYGGYGNTGTNSTGNNPYGSGYGYNTGSYNNSPYTTPNTGAAGSDYYTTDSYSDSYGNYNDSGYDNYNTGNYGSYTPPTSSGSASGGSYVVKKNDTLWGISRRHGVTLEELKSANGLTGDIIVPGQTLRIP